jgi:hypothetical protein
MAELAGRHKKKSLIKVFPNSFFEYKMYTPHTHFVCKVSTCENQRSFWENLFFGSPEKLRKCYTIIIKQRLLSIILCSTLIIFLSVILYGQVLLKKIAMYAEKKSSFCPGNDQRNKHIWKICNSFLGKKSNVKFL